MRTMTYTGPKTTIAKPDESNQTTLELAERGCVGAQTGSLGTFAEHLGRFVATNTTAPLTTLLLVLVRAAGKKIPSISMDHRDVK